MQKKAEEMSKVKT